MKPKELKRLSRNDLLEMLLALSKENDALRAANIQLKSQLEDRSIAIRESGSLAEAALKLNGIFEAAQAACDQYTENIRSRNEELDAYCAQREREIQEKCEQMLAQAKAQAEEYQARAEDYMAQAKARTEEYQAQAEEYQKQAKAQAEEYLAQAQEQLRQQQGSYSWLAGILETGKPGNEEA